MIALPWLPGGFQQKPLPVDCDQMIVTVRNPEQKPRMITLNIKDGVLQPSEVHGEYKWEQVEWYLPIRPTSSKSLLR